MFEQLGTIATIISGVIAGLWTLGIYINSKFEGTKNFVENKFDKLTDKLEYHEQHDDKRFSGIGDSLWELRLKLSDFRYYRGMSGSKEEDCNIRRKTPETSTS